MWYGNPSVPVISNDPLRQECFAAEPHAGNPLHQLKPQIRNFKWYNLAEKGTKLQSGVDKVVCSHKGTSTLYPNESRPQCLPDVRSGDITSLPTVLCTMYVYFIVETSQEMPHNEASFSTLVVFVLGALLNGHCCEWH